MKNIRLICFLLFCLFFLTFCSSEVLHDSTIYLGSCFSEEPESVLTEKLGKLTKDIEDLENPYEAIAIAGCYNYQLGHPTVLAEKWLNEAFNQEQNKQVRIVAAAALGFIYLKERQVSKIKPYIATAKQGSLGRWMLILYYIDLYRERDDITYLSSAIKTLEAEHQEEGITSDTERLMELMRSIHGQDKNCSDNPEGESCILANLSSDKRFLFRIAVGHLAFYLKEPPFFSQFDEPEEPQSAQLTVR